MTLFTPNTNTLKSRGLYIEPESKKVSPESDLKSQGLYIEPESRWKTLADKKAKVLYALDGDTAVLETEDGEQITARIPGVNTPETAKFGEPQDKNAVWAREKFKREFEGKDVTIKMASFARGEDAYGRALADIELPDGTTASALMGDPKNYQDNRTGAEKLGVAAEKLFDRTGQAWRGAQKMFIENYARPAVDWLTPFDGSNFLEGAVDTLNEDAIELRDKYANNPDLYRPSYEPVEGTGWQKFKGNFKAMLNPVDASATLIENAAPSAITLGFGVLGGPAGLAVGSTLAGGMAMGQDYEESSMRPGDDATKALHAIAIGIGEAASERVGAEALLGVAGKAIAGAANMGTRSTMSKLARMTGDAAKLYGAGAGEEAIAQINSNFWDNMYFEQRKSLFEGVPESAAVGGAMEFLMGAGPTTIGHTLNWNNPKTDHALSQGAQQQLKLLSQEEALAWLEQAKTKAIDAAKSQGIKKKATLDSILNLFDIEIGKVKAGERANNVKPPVGQPNTNPLGEQDVLQQEEMQTSQIGEKLAVDETQEVEITDEQDQSWQSKDKQDRQLFANTKKKSEDALNNQFLASREKETLQPEDVAETEPGRRGYAERVVVTDIDQKLSQMPLSKLREMATESQIPFTNDTDKSTLVESIKGLYQIAARNETVKAIRLDEEDGRLLWGQNDIEDLSDAELIKLADKAGIQNDGKATKANKQRIKDGLRKIAEDKTAEEDTEFVNQEVYVNERPEDVLSQEEIDPGVDDDYLPGKPSKPTKTDLYDTETENDKALKSTIVSRVAKQNRFDPRAEELAKSESRVMDWYAGEEAGIVRAVVIEGQPSPDRKSAGPVVYYIDKTTQELVEEEYDNTRDLDEVSSRAEKEANLTDEQTAYDGNNARKAAEKRLRPDPDANSQKEIELSPFDKEGKGRMFEPLPSVGKTPAPVGTTVVRNKKGDAYTYDIHTLEDGSTTKAWVNTKTGELIDNDSDDARYLHSVWRKTSGYEKAHNDRLAQFAALAARIGIKDAEKFANQFRQYMHRLGGDFLRDDLGIGRWSEDWKKKNGKTPAEIIVKSLVRALNEQKLEELKGYIVPPKGKGKAKIPLIKGRNTVGELLTRLQRALSQKATYTLAELGMMPKPGQETYQPTDKPIVGKELQKKLFQRDLPMAKSPAKAAEQANLDRTITVDELGLIPDDQLEALYIAVSEMTNIDLDTMMVTDTGGVALGINKLQVLSPELKQARAKMRLRILNKLIAEMNAELSASDPVQGKAITELMKQNSEVASSDAYQAVKAADEAIRSTLPTQIANAVKIVFNKLPKVNPKWLLSAQSVAKKLGTTSTWATNWLIGQQKSLDINKFENEQQVFEKAMEMAKQKLNHRQYDYLRKAENAFLHDNENEAFDDSDDAKDILDRFNEWEKVLFELFKTNPYFIYEMSKVPTKQLSDKNKEKPGIPVVSRIALIKTYEYALAHPKELGLYRLYEKLEKQMAAEAIDEMPSASGKGKWYKIPRTNKNDPLFKVRESLFQKLSHPNWCTATWNAGNMLQRSTQYILVVDGVSVNGIEIDDRGYIDDVTSINNNGTASIDWLDDTVALLEALGVAPFQSRAMVQAKKAKEKGRTDKDLQEQGNDVPPYDLDNDFPEQNYEEEIDFTISRNATAVTELNTLRETGNLERMRSVLQRRDWGGVEELARRGLNGTVGGVSATRLAMLTEQEIDEAVAEMNQRAEELRVGDQAEPNIYAASFEAVIQKRLYDKEAIAAQTLLTQKQDIERTRELVIAANTRLLEHPVDLLYVTDNDFLENGRVTITAQYLDHILQASLIAPNTKLYTNLRLVEQDEGGSIEFDIDNITRHQAEQLDPMIDALMPFSKTIQGRIEGWTTGSEAVVNAATIKAEDAPKIALHELAHLGMVKLAKKLGGLDELHSMLWAAKKELFKEAPNLLKRTGHKSIEDLAIDYGFDINSKEGQTKILMELTARWAERFETYKPESWWTQLLGKLAEWVKKFTGIELTKKQVTEMVSGFVKIGTGREFGSEVASPEKIETVDDTTMARIEQARKLFQQSQPTVPTREQVTNLDSEPAISAATTPEQLVQEAEQAKTTPATATPQTSGYTQQQLEGIIEEIYSKCGIKFTEEMPMDGGVSMLNKFRGDQAVELLEIRHFISGIQNRMKAILGLRKYDPENDKPVFGTYTLKEVSLAMQAYIQMKEYTNWKEFYGELPASLQRVCDLAEQMFASDNQILQDLKKVAEDIDAETSRWGDIAEKNGIIEKGQKREHYLTSLWDMQKSKRDFGTKVLITSPNQAKKRTLKGGIFEGWSKGGVLKYEDITHAVMATNSAISQAKAARHFIDTAIKHGIFAVDGRKKGIPVGYVELNVPIISKNVRNGARVYAPKRIADSLNKQFGKSKLHDVWGLDYLTAFNQRIKEIKLTASFWQLGEYLYMSALGGQGKGLFGGLKSLNVVGDYNRGKQLVQSLNSLLKELVHNSLQLEMAQDFDPSYKRPESKLGQMAKSVPGLKQAWQLGTFTGESIQKFTFEKVGAYLKANAAVNLAQIELARNAKRIERGEVTRAEILKAVAKTVNDQFGGLNYADLGIGDTWQTLGKNLLFGHDFTLANARRVVKSFSKTDEGRMHRAMWANVAMKGGLMWLMGNMAMAFMDDEDFLERIRLAWKNGGLNSLNFMKVDVTPIYRLLDEKSKDRKYVNVISSFKETLRWMTSPVRLARAKQADSGRILWDAMLGKDFSWKTFTNVDEISGQKPGKMGKNLSGKISDYQAEGDGFFIDKSQFPSFLAYEAMAMAPLAVSGFINFMMGEMDGFDFALSSLGADISTTYESDAKPPKEETQKLFRQRTGLQNNKFTQELYYRTHERAREKRDRERRVLFQN